MIKYLVLIIFIIIIFNRNPSKQNVKKVIENFKDYSIVFSFLPYYFEFNQDKVNSMYFLIDLLKEVGRKDDYITIKLLWFKDSNSINLEKLEKFIKYAKSKNIIVGISSYLKKYKKEEINTYLTLLKKGYTNTFITLATYHSDIDNSVDMILKNNGSIRLVKGWWNDGDIKDWKIVSEKYYLNAKKLVKNKNNHILATHDFTIIKKLFNEYKTIDNIEFSFFMFNHKFVKNNINSLPFKIKKKSFYKVYGNNLFNLPLLYYSNFYNNTSLIFKSIKN